MTILAGLLAFGGWEGRPVQGQDLPSREVLVFGVLATPDDQRIDPALADVAPQLRKLIGKHGFRLLGSKSRRLTVRQAMTCDLGRGMAARVELLDAFDPSGNVLLRFELDSRGQNQFQTSVATPPNQLFFCDKLFPDGSRLVLGVGAR